MRSKTGGRRHGEVQGKELRLACMGNIGVLSYLRRYIPFYDVGALIRIQVPVRLTLYIPQW